MCTDVSNMEDKQAISITFHDAITAWYLLSTFVGSMIKFKVGLIRRSWSCYHRPFGDHIQQL